MQPTDGRQQHLSTPLSPRRPPLSLPSGPSSNFSTECLHNNTKRSSKTVSKFNTFNHYDLQKNHSSELLDSEVVNKYSKFISTVKTSHESNTTPAKHLKNYQISDDKTRNHFFNINNDEPTIVKASYKSVTKYDKPDRLIKVSDSSNNDTSDTPSNCYTETYKNSSKSNAINYYDLKKNNSAEILDSETLHKYSEFFSTLKTSHDTKTVRDSIAKPAGKQMKNSETTDDKFLANQRLCDIPIGNEDVSVGRSFQKSLTKGEKQSAYAKPSVSNDYSPLSSNYSRDYFPDNNMKNPKNASKFNTFNHYDLQKNHSKETLDPDVFNKYSKLFSAIKALNESKIVNNPPSKSISQHKNHYDVDIGGNEEVPVVRSNYKLLSKSDKYDKAGKTSDFRDTDSAQSFELENIPVYNLKSVTHGPQYVDMERIHKDKKSHGNNINYVKDKTGKSKSSKLILQSQQNNQLNTKKVPGRNGSCDSKVLPSFNVNNENYDHNTPSVNQNKNYEYLHKQAKYKKRTSVTSSTSEDNDESLSLSKSVTEDRHKFEHRNKEIRSKFESATVDRRFSKRSANANLKMNRRGSCNFDSSDDFHLPQNMSKNKNVSHSVKNCASGKMPLGDKTPLQISAEDMVQIANCGARNKNGSLCHFISTNNDNYLSISQALLNNPVPNDNNTIGRKKKQYSHEKSKKRSMASLPFDSSDETISADDIVDFRPRRNKERSAEYLELEVKGTELPYKNHRVREIKSKPNKAKQDIAPARKINDLGIPKTHNGYFALKDEPTILRAENPKREIDQSTMTSYGVQSKGKINRDKCLSHHHSVLQPDCSCRDNAEGGGGGNPGNSVFHIGASGKEELRALCHDVEESFDF